MYENKYQDKKLPEFVGPTPGHIYMLDLLENTQAGKAHWKVLSAENGRIVFVTQVGVQKYKGVCFPDGHGTLYILRAGQDCSDIVINSREKVYEHPRMARALRMLWTHLCLTELQRIASDNLTKAITLLKPSGPTVRERLLAKDLIPDNGLVLNL